MPFDYYYTLSTGTKVEIYTYVTVKRITIIRGFLFPSYDEIEFVSKVDIFPQYSARDVGDYYTKIWVALQRVD